MAVQHTKANWLKIAVKFLAEKTLLCSSFRLAQLKLGFGIITPDSARNMVAKPRITTTQSSVKENDLDRRHAAPEKFDWTSFKYGMSVCHQAIYVKRDLAEPYDTSYRLSADIDWVIRAAKKATHIVNVKQYVAKYLVGGMSQQRHRESLKERYAIFRKHYGFVPNLINHGVIAVRLFLFRLKNGKTRD